MLLTRTFVILSKRIWFAIPALGFCLALGTYTDLSSSPFGRSGLNEWDIMMGVFDSPIMVAVIFPILFFSLIVSNLADDFSDTSTYNEFYRFPSRFMWTVNKLFTVGIVSLIYTMMLWISVVLFCVIFVPLQMSWSKASIMSATQSLGMLSANIYYMKPPIIMFRMYFLIFWGLFTWGCLVVMVGSLFRRPFIGWLCGAILSMLSYGIWMTQPTDIQWAPTLQMLLKAHYSYFSDQNIIPPNFNLLWSIIADSIVCFVAIVGGHVALRRRLI